MDANNSSIQLYWNKNRTAIGYWAHSLNRVQAVAGQILDGRWMAMDNIMVNGKPLFPSEDWEPIPYDSIY